MYLRLVVLRLVVLPLRLLLRFLAAAALRPFSGCNLLCCAGVTFFKLLFLAVLALCTPGLPFPPFPPLL